MFDHSFINTDGKLMLSEYRTYALERVETEGERTKHSYFGEDMKLRINPDLGYAVFIKEGDGEGTRVFYLDEAENEIEPIVM